jgi:hypothetical protein
MTASQRIEEVIVVPAREGEGRGLSQHLGTTKIRFFNEDGTPFALKGAENKSRLDALEERIAALESAGAENKQAEEESVAEPQQ